jgi:hypothetical protein
MENNYTTRSSNFTSQFFFSHLITCEFGIRSIATNQVEKMSCGVQWLMNHLPSHKNNYIFIYFGMPLKMDDIKVFFIFIQININHEYNKLHMQLQITL